MKRFILAAATAGALVMLQSPAHAQYPGPYNPNPPYPGPYNQPNNPNPPYPGPYNQPNNPNPPYPGPYNPNPPYPGYGPDRYAHPGPDEGNPWDLDQRITWLQDRIARGQESGELDPGVVWRAQQQIQSVRREEERDRERHGGRLTEYEDQHLTDRIETIGREIRWREDYREPWQG
jgi:hypothetical protein